MVEIQCTLRKVSRAFLLRCTAVAKSGRCIGTLCMQDKIPRRNRDAEGLIAPSWELSRFLRWHRILDDYLCLLSAVVILMVVLRRNEYNYSCNATNRERFRSVRVYGRLKIRL